MMKSSAFHLIINENHLYDLSIKTAQELLSDKKLSGEKVALCLEIDATNDWSKIKDIYTDKKEQSDFLTSPFFNDYTSLKNQLSNNGKYSDDVVDKNIFDYILTRNRILAYSNLCQFVDTKNITIFGIDTHQNLPNDKEQAAQMRSEHMYSKLSTLQQNGYSTITVVGTRHVVDLKILNEKQQKLPNCSLAVIKIPGKMPIRTIIHQSVITRFESLITNAEKTEGLGDLEQQVENHKQGLIIIETDNSTIAKNILLNQIKPKKSLKEQIFSTFKLDNLKDEKLELERGLRIAATLNHVTQLPFFFKESLGIKIDINASGPATGKTALHMAVEKGNKNIIIELLQRGAKYDILDNNGKTALQYANSEEIEKLFPQTQYIINDHQISNISNRN